MTLSQHLEGTNPEVFTAILAVGMAYDTLWVKLASNPADAIFVSDMLSYFHAASVLPHMGKLPR
jgi:hypothetical protein